MCLVQEADEQFKTMCLLSYVTNRAVDVHYKLFKHARANAVRSVPYPSLGARPCIDCVILNIGWLQGVSDDLLVKATLGSLHPRRD